MPEVVLETIGLTKSFRKRRAVDDLSLQVFEGDVYGFLGPNGAGKSTTIRMLTALVRPNSGTARLLSHDVRRERVRALQSVGALVESPTFYKYMSARENLKIFSRLSGNCEARRIDQVLEIVGLLDRANDKVKTFSHGMLQRLGIAQALLPNPKLVILDEPTSGLDPQGMKDVRELISRLAGDEKVTVFLSSHLLHEVEQVCTRVGIINRGRLIAEGDVGRLLHCDTDLVEFVVNRVDRALEVLDGLSWVEVQPSPSGRGSIAMSIPAERISEVNRALVTAGVEVSAVIPKAGTLEDLFLELTREAGHAD
ncbi:MAG TPA: ABC transporter ATP-binding protein [Armatimonadota bacterium]|nr:ABC transporter ATP-binding protein [Armatimonadota bacterium]